MNKNLPPEIIQPIIEIVSYVFTFALGVLTKWLQGRNRSPKINSDGT